MIRIAAWLSAFLDDLRERRLHAQVAKCETEIRDIRAWRAHCDVAEAIVNKKKAEAEMRLFLSQRKGKA